MFSDARLHTFFESTVRTFAGMEMFEMIEKE
jgi:hypothetical protein